MKRITAMADEMEKNWILWPLIYTERPARSTATETASVVMERNWLLWPLVYTERPAAQAEAPVRGLPKTMPTGDYFRRVNSYPDIDWDWDHWSDCPREQVPVEGLIATQNWVLGKHVTKHLRGGTPDDGDPLVLLYRGLRYLVNGHHRAVTVMLRGAKNLTARVRRVGRVSSPTVERNWILWPLIYTERPVTNSASAASSARTDRTEYLGGLLYWPRS